MATITINFPDKAINGFTISLEHLGTTYERCFMGTIKDFVREFNEWVKIVGLPFNAYATPNMERSVNLHQRPAVFEEVVMDKSILTVPMKYKNPYLSSEHLNKYKKRNR